eukprot:942999-Rhodomonas_salina.2
MCGGRGGCTICFKHEDWDPSQTVAETQTQIFIAESVLSGSLGLDHLTLRRVSRFCEQQRRQRNNTAL